MARLSSDLHLLQRQHPATAEVKGSSAPSHLVRLSLGVSTCGTAKRLALGNINLFCIWPRFCQVFLPPSRAGYDPGSRSFPRRGFRECLIIPTHRTGPGTRKQPMSNLTASAAETRTRYWPVPTPQHGAGAAPPRGPCSTRTLVTLRYIRNQNLFPDRTQVNFIYTQGAQQLSRASQEDLHLQQDTPCPGPLHPRAFGIF